MIKDNTQQTLQKSATGARGPIGSVLVCGGGVAGIQASLDLSAGGFHVYLIEHNPSVGGGMAKLDKTFPTGDCATCIISPKLVECMRDMNVEVLTLSDVVKLEGEAGNFKATVRQRPRFVDIDKCTACGDCSKVCPVEVASPFDANLGKRKAIDKVYAQAAPNAWMITKKGRATCSSACPIDCDVQAYVALIGCGKVEAAAEVIRRDNPLPSICGRVCFHPCESQCNRGKVDAPINIRDLKRFAIDSFPDAAVSENIEPTGKSVAIVGSGPAGLAAAHSLAQAGHKAVVFESLPLLGGMLAVGIPDYRLPPEILRRDLDAIAALGVEFKQNTSIGENVSVDELGDKFDAIFVATGAHRSRKLDIPGEDCQGVIHGVDFLREFSLGNSPAVGESVVVVGGGNTAVDSARTAARLGAKQVTMIYRRSRQEMPADEAEIEATLHEGIEIKYLATPVSVVAEDGHMTGIECLRMQLGEPDESGRRRPVPIEGSQFLVEADMLVPAVSQSPDGKLAELLELETTARGAIAADEVTLATSRDGVFAGGDVVAGPSSVIEAIAHGKRAAAAIDNYLAGRGAGYRLGKRPTRCNPLGKDELAELKRKTTRAERVKQPQLAEAERMADFREVELIYGEDEARCEALRCLNCASCCECMQCVEACQAGAIIHDAEEKTLELDVGAVVLTPGFEAFDATRRGEFGFGHAANVVTNVQFERLLSASGPTMGNVVRPSDGKKPKRLAFIQCVGSRDTGCGNDYCSSVCCMAATKEAILAKEHDAELDITIFFLDLRAFGKDFDRYCERAKKQLGVRYVRSFISRTYEMPGTKNLRLVHLDEQMKQVEEEFDMIVLSLALEPSHSLRREAEDLDVELNRWGFAATSELCPLDCSRDGVFVGGAFQEPKDIPDTVMQASAAAGRAMALLAPARGTRVKTKVYPPERDIADEPPRIGVFVCHCGSNIASVVDVEGVVKAAKQQPHVVFAETNMYTCADDSQDHMKEIIIEQRLNRVVVASCTPRTHEPIFRDTLRDAGLNPFLLEMANIRDQCSWVHAADHQKATHKAIDLVRMAVGRTVGLMPLQQETVAVNNAALIVGGGIAGMTAALALAAQGFPVHIVEKQSQLGGTARQLHHTLDGGDIQAFLADTIKRVQVDPLVNVHLQSRAAKVDGHIGAFTSTLTTESEDGEPASREIKHGVVVVATGASEHKPQSFGYGKDRRVLTQLELSERIGSGQLDLPEKPTIVMIQCVEQRDEERPYCSRVCCTSAVKNSLQLKKRYPQATIVVLYRDIRTYGFREAAYREAREKGVLFIRYDTERPPRVDLDGAVLVRAFEPTVRRELELSADMLVLASPMIPRADRQELSELLRVPLNADGFFLEAHVKLRPVEFASEGLFLCGTAHAPKFITETISQANAVASRATSVLSRNDMAVGGQIAWVDQDKCISCMTCVHVCPYMAPRVNEVNKAEVQSATCMGCGSCTAECPARAITLRHFADVQIIGALEGLFQDAPPAAGDEKCQATEHLIQLEKVGVAPPRWKRS